MLAAMLLSEVPRPFKRQGWGFESKCDGWRCVAQVKDGRAAIRTRRGTDATTWWPEIARGLSAFKGHHIVDGEVRVLDELGRSDFERLQSRPACRVGRKVPTRWRSASSMCSSMRAATS